MLRATVATRSLTFVGCDTMLHAADIAKFPCQHDLTDWRIEVRREPTVVAPSAVTQHGSSGKLPDGRRVICDKDGTFSLVFDKTFSDITLTLQDDFCHVDIYHYLYTAHTFAYHLLSCGGGGVHSAGFVCGGKAVLLVGASGVGKSTMLDRVMALDKGMTVLCEDITAVMQEEGGFRAYGTPFCGEDTRCANASAPLGAIVLLKQAKHNRVHRASFEEAMFGLTESVLRPVYATALCEAAADLAVSLARDVPVFVFENDGTPQAGERLLATLIKE